jgi:hypothetical protein
MINGQPGSLSFAGLILAAFVAVSAFFLARWEEYRPKWPRHGALDRLSIRLRSIGIRLMWVESLLLAVGSQIPIEMREDRLLFVTIWAINGFMAIILLTIALFDAIVRFVAHRIRATAIQEVLNSRIDNDDRNENDTCDIP